MVTRSHKVIKKKVRLNLWIQIWSLCLRDTQYLQMLFQSNYLHLLIQCLCFSLVFSRWSTCDWFGQTTLKTSSVSWVIGSYSWNVCMICACRLRTFHNIQKKKLSSIHQFSSCSSCCCSVICFILDDGTWSKISQLTRRSLQRRYRFTL